MKLDAGQLETLRHMLGINTPDDRVPQPYRDYYCANPGDAELLALEAAGAVERYSMHGGYHWYRCTPAGRAAAMASHREIRSKRSRRVYSKWLDVQEALPDVTFHEFLTNPVFADTRRNA